MREGCAEMRGGRCFALSSAWTVRVLVCAGLPEIAPSYIKPGYSRNWAASVSLAKELR